ncbi:MAG TPA: hypothetical protein ENN99_12695 [Chloroflexi bacterium]|nr:hypothetical protein [Chloroflexota bacterium]
MGIPSSGIIFDPSLAGDREKEVIEAYQGDLVFNGINGATGEYGLPPMPAEKLARLIQGNPQAEDFASEEQRRYFERLTTEQQELLNSLSPDRRSLFDKLAAMPQQIDQLMDQQRDTFEQLSADLQPQFSRLVEEQRRLFQQVMEEQTRVLWEGLDDEQQGWLQEMLAERHSEYERQKHLGELEFKVHLPTDFPVKEGVDPTDLKQAGWAVIFPAEMEALRREKIKAALSELLALRKEQAGKLFRIYEGSAGYRPGETKAKFLQRHRVGAGAADPAEMPFYVLLVGSPEEIPYEFQYQLDVMRGVGRLDFSTEEGDDLDAYARYAHNILLAETGQVKLPRRAAFFAVSNPGDQATQLSTRYLIQPLLDNLAVRAPGGEIELTAEWEFCSYVKDQAGREQLQGLLGGDPGQTPALLMTASHGMEFPLGDPHQLEYQGALLCQDWPGPKGKLQREHYFTAEDLAPNANLLGLIAFFFACYGAGTPKFDQFATQAFKRPTEIASRNFTAALPQALLRRGALAVLGHVERAWGYSFVTPTGDVDNLAFVTALRKLLNGDPVGLATDPGFNLRYADMSSQLSAILEERKYDPPYTTSDHELAQIWTANNDARGYVVLGDPAVRIPFARPDETVQERPVVSQVSALAPSAAALEAAEKGLREPSPTKPEEILSAAESFGLREQVSDLAGSIRKFTDQLATALGKAAADLATLEVKTFTADDLTTLEGSRLRALTRIKFDGDMQVYVPEMVGGIAEELRHIHVEMVREAQANRAQFIGAMAEVATNLLKSLT